MKPQQSHQATNNFFLEKAIIAIAVLFHVAISGFPLVNLEWAFSDAALFFTNNDHRYIDQYFEYQANTLAVPFIAAFFAKIFPFLSITTLPRIFSAIGFIFLGEALLKINRIVKTNIPGYLLLLIVFLNPLLWTFGGRGTADFPPAALGIFGLALFWEQNDGAWKKYLAVCLLGIGIILKYHTVLLLAPIVLEIFLRKDQKWKTAMWKAGTTVTGALILPVLYILLVKQELGFWLTPPIYMERHKLSASEFFTNFSIYFGYLALLLLPFSVFSFWYFIRHFPSKNKVSSIFIVIIIGSILFTLGYFWLRPQGEMNFGPLDGMLSAAISGGSFMMLALTMGIILYQGFEQIGLHRNGLLSNRYILCMIAGVGIFLFILSFTRPTQRYLMFILPFAYFFLLPMILGNKKNIFVAIVMYSIMNFFLLSNQYATGTAAQDMVKEIRERGIVEKTEGGAINAHAGNIFFPYRQYNKEYMIVGGAPAGSLYTAKAGFLPMAKKSYSLIAMPRKEK